jgi:hypothetical protein
LIKAETREAAAYEIVSNQTLPLLMLVTPAGRKCNEKASKRLG